MCEAPADKGKDDDAREQQPAKAPETEVPDRAAENGPEVVVTPPVASNNTAHVPSEPPAQPPVADAPPVVPPVEPNPTGNVDKNPGEPNDQDDGDVEENGRRYTWEEKGKGKAKVVGPLDKWMVPGKPGKPAEPIAIGGSSQSAEDRHLLELAQQFWLTPADSDSHSQLPHTVRSDDLDGVDVAMEDVSLDSDDSESDTSSDRSYMVQQEDLSSEPEDDLVHRVAGSTTKWLRRGGPLRTDVLFITSDNEQETEERAKAESSRSAKKNKKNNATKALNHPGPWVDSARRLHLGPSRELVPWHSARVSRLRLRLFESAHELASFLGVGCCVAFTSPKSKSVECFLGSQFRNRVPARRTLSSFLPLVGLLDHVRESNASERALINRLNSLKQMRRATKHRLRKVRKSKRGKRSSTKGNESPAKIKKNKVQGKKVASKRRTRQTEIPVITITSDEQPAPAHGDPATGNHVANPPVNTAESRGSDDQ